MHNAPKVLNEGRWGEFFILLLFLGGFTELGGSFCTTKAKHERQSGAI